MSILKYRIHARDTHCLYLMNEENPKRWEREYVGYAPEALPEGGGDDCTLIIDVDTGMILNWKASEVKEWLKEADSPGGWSTKK